MIHNAGASDFETATQMFQVATDIASELGLQPLTAHCYLGLADFYERKGQHEEAVALRARSQDLLDRLGMKPWFRPAREDALGYLPRLATP
jgi:hypothetical protein